MDCRRRAQLSLLVAATIVALAQPAAAAAPVVTVLHAFTGGDGGFPVSLIQATDGNFYGTTANDGSEAAAVFQMTPAGTFTILRSLPGGLWRGGPEALIQATDGNFYGTTIGSCQSRFPQDCPQVFRMTPAGTVTVLVELVGPFAANLNGPATLIQATDGSFYGT